MREALRALDKRFVITIVGICIFIITMIGTIVFFNEKESTEVNDKEVPKHVEDNNSIMIDKNENISNIVSVEKENEIEVSNSVVNVNSSGNVVSNFMVNNAVKNTSGHDDYKNVAKNEIKNREYVSERVEEIERQTTENLNVSWQNMELSGKIANINIEDLKIIAEKFSSEDEKTVVAGDTITYSIEVKNVSRNSQRGVKVSDVVPLQTQLIQIGELSDGVKAEVNESDNKMKICWTVDFKSGEESKILSFIVRVKDDAKGTIRNAAVVNGEKTNETKNTIINTVKTSEIVKCDKNEVDGNVVHENDEIKYTLMIENTGDVNEKISINDKIKEGLSYKVNSLEMSDQNANVIVENGEILLNDYEILAGTSLRISFVTIVNQLGMDKINDEFVPITSAVIKANKVIVNSKETTDKNPDGSDKDYDVIKPYVKITKTSRITECVYSMNEIKEVVHEGDIIEYTIRVSNEKGTDSEIISLSDAMPNGLSYVDKSLNDEAVIAGVNVIDNVLTLSDYRIEAGDILNIVFKVSVDELGMIENSDGSISDIDSARLEANKVIVNGDKENPIEDPDPPIEVRKPIITTTKVSEIIECTKGQLTGNTVHEGDKIKYTITIENTGTEYKMIDIVDNLKGGVTLEEDTIDVSDNGANVSISDDKRTISINSYKIDAGCILTICFDVTVDELEENITKATIEANQVSVDKNITTDEKTYEVVKPNINVQKYVYDENDNDIDGKTVGVYSKIKYVLVGTNVGTENSEVTITDDIDISKLTDVSVSGIIKEGIENSIEVMYDEETGKLSWSGELKKNSENKVIITVEAMTRNLLDSEISYDIENMAKYVMDKEEKNTNRVVNHVEIVIEADKAATVLNRAVGEADGVVEYNDIVEYTITAKNTSNSIAKIKIIDPLPNEVEYSRVLDGKENPIVVKVNGINVDEATYDENSKTIKYEENVAGEETLTITFNVRIISTDLNKNIVNTATINGIEKSVSLDVVKKMKISSTSEVTKSLDLVLVLDVSRSMTNNNIGRLSALKVAAKALVEKVFPEGVETNSTVTIITYSKDASTSPTYVYSSKANAISKINGLSSIDGTDINDGLKAANDLLTGASLKNDKKVVIFLSDGAPTVPKDKTGLIEKGDTNSASYQNNSVDNIVESANILKAKADMVYAIGLGTETGLASNKCAYVLECSELQDGADGQKCETIKHQNMNNVVAFDGVKISRDRKKYHYYTETSLAKFVLKTIGKTRYIPVADGADTTETTNNLGKEFDEILKDVSTAHYVVSTSELPAVITIPEKANVVGMVGINIGNEYYEYNYSQLLSGISINGDILKYEKGIGFTFTINDNATLEKELSLKYKIDMR